MCGIVGSFGNIPRESTVREAVKILEHRGPDDEGLYYKEGMIALGHRRLSIIDLSTDGHQPMKNSDGRFVIIFNGEIYNYREIRKDLENVYQFETQSDTEVLLAAYALWGPECLKRFNGMFAFSIWDEEKRELFCARDRLGIKPFYYAWNDGTIHFASEIKSLLKLGVEPKPNEQIIFDYLYYGLYDHEADTFFEGISRLPAGYYMTVKDGSLSLNQYWDISEQKEELDKLTDREAEEKFRGLIADSIRLRFRSDVPVGLTLSSGLDSNALLEYAYKEIGGINLHLFSGCVESKEYNECPIIRESLSEEQMKYWHTGMTSPGDVFEKAELMNSIQDEPYGGIATILYMTPNEEAKKKDITVLLEGQGVDEILAGYKYYLDEYKKDISSEIEVSDESPTDIHQDLSKMIHHDILSEDFTKEFYRDSSFPKPFSSHLKNAQFRDIVYTKLPRALRFNDHLSMHYSRELRVPFLDHRIVEFCFHLPDKFKIDNDEQKVLIRRIAGKELNDSIKKRHKKAFTAVQTDWFRDELKNEVMKILNSDSFRSRKYWNMEKLDKKIKAFYDGDLNNSFFIWQCINLELWFRKFIDKAKIATD